MVSVAKEYVVHISVKVTHEKIKHTWRGLSADWQILSLGTIQFQRKKISNIHVCRVYIHGKVRRDMSRNNVEQKQY